ncbi:hypothetical protein F5Y14DRAFT_288461 [Nemania sp. NC0429]|nr:hypothetical protein F5Y14DRAFT_288461 [Nemania sp. NC0429]
MADRGGSKARIRRAPLGDATDRIINASPHKPGKHAGPQDTKPNPLRAHPISGASTKKPLKKAAALASNTLVAAVKNHAKPPASVETSYKDSRCSQISTSSGASNGNRKTHIGPWQLGKTLGKGSAARVRLARHSTTQDVVAVKILAKDMTQITTAGSMAELDRWDRTRDEFNTQRQIPLSIEREVAVLKLIDHPHIVKLHDIWENRAEIYLVLEYMDGGDMFTYVDAYGPLPEFEMVGYFRQILSALEYVHSFNICHRDLKPENILMKSEGVVKIADFGMAAIQQSPTHALRTSCGSPHYAAPELISRARYQGDKVDIWSMGCVLYATLCRRLPFDDPDGNVPRLLAKARRGVYAVPDTLSREAQDLIAKMLTVDPVRRISIRKIWKHPLIQKYDDLDDLNNGTMALNFRASDKSKPVPLEEIDVQILRQLKSIWHTFSERQIAMQLSSAQPNDQKLFYWLLLSYREQKLENYDADLTYSPSDYHHLRPANWKKKVTTAEFPSRYGRTPSRFTVISTVPTNGSIDEADVTDGGGTIQSYDPYKSSRVMENAYASHARIIVHRNGSTANHSSRSSASRHGRNGSCRTASTRSRQTRSGRRIAAPAAMRASRYSLGSIKSGESAPYTRPASRRKRRVNFSHVQLPSASQHDLERRTSRVAGEDKAVNGRHPSPMRSIEDTVLPINPNGRSRAGTQSMVNISRIDSEAPEWNEEVREFSHSIARDCDDAFNSSLLDEDSYLCSTPKAVAVSVDAPSLLGKPGTRTPTPWDHRPLPPTPPTTASVAHEIMMAKRRRVEKDGEDSAPSTHLNYVSMAEDEQNRRTVSAPIYSQYSTQWGKDKIPLPSIEEKLQGDVHGKPSDKSRAVSAPVWHPKGVSGEMDDHEGLGFLSQHANTIRIVNSPSSKPRVEANTLESSDTNRHVSRGATVHSQPTQELSLRQRFVNDELMGPPTGGQETTAEDFNRPTITKKKSTWFKRGSKEREDIEDPKEASTANRIDHLASASTSSSTDGPTRKKSFSLAFWRNSKNSSDMQMSREASENEDISNPKPVRMFSHPARPYYHDGSNKGGDGAAKRNIEPQQNWLARLFRVKPATKHLCFSLSRRRARQEIVILLKEWRQYGIRDIEVDKQRNIVFARLGSKNYLNLKEVAFAVEIMMVIEHGKRAHLSIARFTQERGAASSFHKVVDTINSVFSERNLLVVEKRKVKMMIKTLNS